MSAGGAARATHVAFTGSAFVDPSRNNAVYTGLHSFMDRHLHKLKEVYSRPTGATAKAVRRAKAAEARTAKQTAFFKKCKDKGAKGMTAVHRGKALHSELEAYVRHGAPANTDAAQRALACLLNEDLRPCDAEVGMADITANLATSADLVCERKNKRTGEKEYVVVEVKLGMDSNKHGTGHVWVDGYASMPWTPLNRAKMQVAMMLAINRGEVKRGVAKYAFATGYVLNVRTLDERLVEVGNAGWCKALSVDKREGGFPQWCE